MTALIQLGDLIQEDYEFTAWTRRKDENPWDKANALFEQGFEQIRPFFEGDTVIEVWAKKREGK